MRKFVLVVGLLFSINVAAGGHFQSGYDLEQGRIEYEKSQLGIHYNAFYAGNYTGYIEGVYDQISNMEMICAPIDMKAMQLFSIVGNLVKSIPEKWNESASSIVFLAIYQKYSCKK